jgi:long-chain alkane monooxygenase
MSAVPSARPRPLHFAAFVINTTGDAIQSNWRRTLTSETAFDDLERLVRLARTLERGRFDAVFFAEGAQHLARWRRGDGGKVHRINHRGPRYQVVGPHLVSPSPQRTPLLFRAAGSEADRTFAARNAEAVFLQSPSPAAAAHDTADIRSRAASYGRLPQDIKFFQGLRVVTGGTEAEATRKAAELDEQTGGAAWLSPYAAADGRIAGTPEQVADELASWRDAGIDGINLVNSRIPGPYEEFVDHVTPVLQERGLMQREYAEGTLRQKLFGRGDRLPERHPAACYRGAFAPEHA